MIEAYTRKSRALGDPDDPELLATHHHLIRQMAAEDGVELPAAAIHTEIGSGETIADRPVFSERLKQWERLPPGIGGTIYTPALARLTRGTLAERGRIAEAIARADLRIRTPGRTWNLRDPDDEMLFGILTSVDRAELGRFKQRVSDTRDRQLREGIVRIGRPPFGYIWSKDAGTFLPHPEEFPILKECCRRITTFSAKRLAAEYKIGRDSLTDALRNPVICGWPAKRWGPSPTKTAKRSDYVRLPREQWLWPEQPNESYPHACSLEQWQVIQVVLDDRHKGRLKTASGDDWCRNVVWFPHAPGRVHLSAYWYTRRKPRLSYATYQATTPGWCNFVARDQVHRAAFETIRTIFHDEEFLGEALRQLDGRALEQTEDGEHRRNIASDLIQLRQKYQQTLDNEMDAESPIHREALRERRRRLERQIERLEKALNAAQAESRIRSSCPFRSEDIRAIMSVFEHEWEAMEDDEKRLLVNAIIARITVHVEKKPGIRQPIRTLEITLADWLRSDDPTEQL